MNEIVVNKFWIKKKKDKIDNSHLVKGYTNFIKQ
jgi:hypothetical protein